MADSNGNQSARGGMPLSDRPETTDAGTTSGNGSGETAPSTASQPAAADPGTSQPDPTTAGGANPTGSPDDGGHAGGVPDPGPPDTTASGDSGKVASTPGPTANDTPYGGDVNPGNVAHPTLGAGDIGHAANGLGDGAFGTLGTLGELGQSGNGDPLVSVSGGPSGGTPILDQGILHTAPGDAPLGIAVGDAAGIGNFVDIHALDGSNGSIVSGAAGADGSPLAIADVLTNGNGNSPIGLDIGHGQNIADATLLGASPLPGQIADGLSNVVGGPGDASTSNIVTGNVGEAGGSPLANAGILTGATPDSPVGVDALMGPNAVTANALGHTGDLLNFPNFGGAGADSLNGIAPSLPNVADAGSIVGDGGDHSGPSLLDVAHDGSLLQVHDDHSSLVTVDHLATI